MNLNKEAEEFSKQYLDSHNYIRPFIKGANSKYVQAKIIQAQISILRKSTYEGYIDLMEELQQQLKQLENDK